MAQIITTTTSVQLAPVQVYDSYSTLSDSETTVNANESMYAFFIQTPYKQLSCHPIFRFIFKKMGYLNRSQQENYHKFLKKIQKKSITDTCIHIPDFFTIEFIIGNYNTSKDLFIAFVSMMLSRYDNKKMLEQIEFDPVIVIKEAILTDNLSMFKIGLQKISKSKLMDSLGKYYGREKVQKQFLEIIFATGQKIARYFINHLLEPTTDTEESYFQFSIHERCQILMSILNCKCLPFDMYIKVLKVATTNKALSFKSMKNVLFYIYSKDYNLLCKIAKLISPEDFEIDDLARYASCKAAFKIAYFKNETKIQEEYIKWINKIFDKLLFTTSVNCTHECREVLKIIILGATFCKSFESVITDHKDKISESLKRLDYNCVKTFHEYKLLLTGELAIPIKPLMMFGDYHEHIKQDNQQKYDKVINLLSENVGGNLEYGPISIIFEYL